MKILTTGLLVFVSWSAVSTYVYVCKIKDLCIDQTPNTTVIPKKPNARIQETSGVPNPDSLILNFDFNDTVFIPRKELTNYSARAKEYMDSNPEKKMYITGNTDDIGSETYNKDLGMNRAIHVKEFFIEQGIEEKRIIIKSESMDEPVAPNKTSSRRSKNRRVKIEIK